MKNRKQHPFADERINKNFNREENDLPGYPVYPSAEDIYSTDEEADLNPEDLSKKKDIFKFTELQQINDIESGDDLDVPGAELDDEQEFTGNEDEENNYFSLGGDNHESLEEDHIDEGNGML